MVSNRFLVFLFLLSSTLAEFPLVPEPYVIEPRDDAVSYKLPSDTVPLSYDITLEPLFAPDFIFNGFVTISIRVEEPTSVITLHAYQLKIDEDSVTVRESNGVNNIAVSGIVEDEDMQFLHINLEEEVQQNDLLDIYIEYIGDLNRANRGFYLANYVQDGEEKWFGTTQFEPTSARQAFPCYDEPALKATFEIHLIRPEAYNSISNMPFVDSETLPENKFQDNFAVSVLMSTYLVAFVVSEMEHVEEGSQAVYAARDLIEDDRGDYGLAVGIETLRVIQEFTNVDYKLSKMFQVGIPDDFFSAGAMENWGLVTYKERYLLYKEGLTTAAEKQNIASIIAHEYGHQWFGNLVSPLWWSYIWLNEGFATYFEYYATSVVEGEMRMMDQMVVRTHQYAMESDALTTTRPMTYDAQTPQAISALFDRIAYDKSGSVIRMMEHFLTTEIFRRGLELYLNAMEFDAAQADDLWEGLQSAVEQINPQILGELTVKDIMDTWNDQAGFPVVTVSRSDGVIVLRQSKFLLNDASNDNTRWTIPINYAKSDSPVFTDTTATYWLQASTENTGITIEDDEWIILNKQETGFYRVNYDEDNWKLIIEHLRSENYNQIHLLNRAQLVDDAFNLARSGRLSYNITLDLLTYLSNEADYIPLYSFFRGLTFLYKHILHSESYDIFKDFVKDILQTAYEAVGTRDTGSHTQKLNRINVLTWLCRFDHEDCVNQMHTQLSSSTAASPDLQTVVYCSGLASQTNADSKWQYLYNRYLGDEAEYLEKGRIVSALGCSTSVAHLTRLLNIVVDKDDDLTMSGADKASAVSGIYTSSKVGLETTFNYILNNFDDVRASLTSNQIATIFSGISDRLTTTDQRAQLQTFINDLPEETQADFSTVFANALANIDANINWADQHMNEIEVWLKVYSSGFGLTVSIPLMLFALWFQLFA